jgi:spermidine synthase
MKAWLKKIFIKVKVLDTMVIDGVPHKIIDKTSVLPNVKNARFLRFKKDGRVYNYSAIYLNPKYHMQPYLIIPQEIIAAWSGIYSLNSALILGCAGCSIPRFIGLHCPACKIVGVELSEELIAVARKYFLLDQIQEQFELVQGDAIQYVKNHSLDHKHNVIFVDIFCQNKIVPEVLTEDFMRSAYNITDDNGIIILNVLGEDMDKVKTLLNEMQLPFENVAAIKKNHSQFLVLTKTADKQKEEVFIRSMKDRELIAN